MSVQQRIFESLHFCAATEIVMRSYCLLSREMMFNSLSVVENCYWFSSKQIADKSQSKHPSIMASRKILCSRRQAICTSGILLCFIYLPSTVLPLKAEEKKELKDEGDSVVGAIKNLFDPNETTKTGKILPKAYLKAAREVVKTLKESLDEDAKDVAKFRRTADAAKESIREYLNGWRGQKAVVAEKSYAALEKAIRSLASFYSKAGPFAPLSEEVKSSILENLNTADANL